MKVSVFTTYTNPEIRKDPWIEATNCYKDFADELIVTGSDWSYDFSWDEIGKQFQKGFDESSGDWVFRMDIDYFIHEKDFNKIYYYLKKYSNFPAISMPQYQFFTPRKYSIKTRLCIALNKKRFPDIKLNGGGDLCLATLNNTLLSPINTPNIEIPIYQYDSIFRTKEIIRQDRARFSRAWYKYFGNYGDRGGPDPDSAYKAWYEMVKKKIPSHVHSIKIDHHPKYIVEKLKNIDSNQFGYNAFGLSDVANQKFNHFLKGYKEKHFNRHILNLKRAISKQTNFS